MPQLFDASSFINILVGRGGEAVSLLKGKYVLDLTIYEIGNALWRMHVLQKKLGLGAAKKLMVATTRLIGWVNILSISGLDLVEIMEIAVDEATTFYDAAYVVACKLKKLTLITDDAKLAEMASTYINVKSSKDL